MHTLNASLIWTPTALWYQSVRGALYKASAKASSQLCNSTLGEEVHSIQICKEHRTTEQAEHSPPNICYITIDIQLKIHTRIILLDE